VLRHFLRHHKACKKTAHEATKEESRLRKAGVHKNCGG
jgi:hypothetical protein